MASQVLVLAAAILGTNAKTALVLQGGGAKGAFQAGVLQHLCNSKLAASWTLLLGTSIGALNAAFLSQYSPEAQCTAAVPALVAEWRAIKSITDLMVRTGTSDPCGLQASAVPVPAVSKHVTGLYLLQDLERQNDGGFTCDMTPALNRYARILDANKIRTSGMEFAAPAVSLETGLVRYFNETTEPEMLFKGVVASGALVPIVPPILIGEERFMDGGVRANLPILHALHRGADQVVAVLLNPLELQRPAQFPPATQPDQFKARLLFLLDVFYDAEFMDDMREACYRYPLADITAYIPVAGVGSMLDFSHTSIEQMLERGQSETRFVQDFCAELGFQRGPLPSWVTFDLGAGAMLLLIVACRLLYCRQKSPRQSKAKVEEDENFELFDVKGRPLDMESWPLASRQVKAKGDEDEDLEFFDVKGRSLDQ